MNRRASKKSQHTSSKPAASGQQGRHRRRRSAKLFRLSPWLLGGCALALLWGAASVSLASRLHMVLNYATFAQGPASLEPFLSSNAAWCFVLLMAAIWLRLFQANLAPHPQRAKLAAGCWALACLPWLFALGGLGSPGYWEVLWLSAWSGWSFALLSDGLSALPRLRRPWPVSLGLTVVMTLLFAAWWYWQSVRYYNDFLLGFNDFGHFTQRLANTAAGRGWLLETPVLPPFWDHFNPGLLLLVPLWKLFPSVHLIFALQALSLAGGALVVWGMAARLGYGSLAAIIFAAAWLAQPAIGQMNLAATYGWHPISLAIPLLLAALLALIAGRPWLALAAAALAMSLEEGVIVVVCLFCATCALLACWPRRGLPEKPGEEPSREPVGEPNRESVEEPLGAKPATHAANPWGLPAAVWSSAALLTGLGFLLVYRYSGIAEFQTGRFVALGNTPYEIILSPLLRPSAFWGQIFRWNKAFFLLSLALPCSLLCLWRGRRWLLPVVLPLGVLIVWDHRPATSLAFQYASVLLPLLWLATLWGAARKPNSCALGALATGLLLSLFVGQMPYSSPTLLDVVAGTYRGDGELQRRASDPDGRWLTQQLRPIRQDGAEVLATGRIAAHLVGNRDVETVGQYVQRREQLAALPDRGRQPLQHYRWLVLDRREGFQQSLLETTQVEAEALAAGFEIVAQRYDIVILQRPPAPR